MSFEYDTQRPHIASFVIVVNDKGEVAFVLRSNTKWMNGFYGLPAGKTEKGESFSEGAIREAKEEIGIDVSTKNLKPILTVHRVSKQKDGTAMEWVDQMFEVREWSGDAYNAEPHMHSELVWFDPDNLPKNVIPEIVESIKAWREGKSYLEYGW